MKYCLNCKKKFDAEDEFCPDCGIKLCEMSQDAGDVLNGNVYEEGILDILKKYQPY